MLNDYKETQNDTKRHNAVVQRDAKQLQRYSE